MEKQSLYRELTAPRAPRRTPETRKKEEAVGLPLERLVGPRRAASLYRELGSPAEHGALRTRTPLTKRKELVAPPQVSAFGLGRNAGSRETLYLRRHEPASAPRIPGRTVKTQTRETTDEGRLALQLLERR